MKGSTLEIFLVIPAFHDFNKNLNTNYLILVLAIKITKLRKKNIFFLIMSLYLNNKLKAIEFAIDEGF